MVKNIYNNIQVLGFMHSLKINYFNFKSLASVGDFVFWTNQIKASACLDKWGLGVENKPAAMMAHELNRVDVFSGGQTINANSPDDCVENGTQHRFAILVVRETLASLTSLLMTLK